MQLVNVEGIPLIEPHEPEHRFSGPTHMRTPEVRSASLQDRLYARNYYGQEGMWCRGINIVGFDLCATCGRNDYKRPTTEMIQHMHDQGSNCFRLPITWERLQGALGSDQLDLVEGVEEVVDFITNTLGDKVIIDPHNNDQGLRFNGQEASRSDFVNLWKAITGKWGSNDNAIFGLYNEPRYGYEAGQNGYFDPDALDYDGTMIEHWRQWMQEAIDEIRSQGSKVLILVPGLHWTGCADWSGANWWGEALDVYQRAGNTRLASLTDPTNYLAYDIHQYMDPKFTGEDVGCGGHDQNFWCMQYPDCKGADYGLGLTIEWARRYNKKLMMTEIGSWPAGDGTEPSCESKLGNFLQRMADSNVFIGYQVWQAGCDQCLADQWTLRPYNLDWYRLNGFRACSAGHQDCRSTQCCTDPAKKCYEKDDGWASCRESCTPGVDPNDPPEYQTPWACNELSPGSPTPTPTPAPSPTPTPAPSPTPGCSANGANCLETQCCQESGNTCYEKDQWWAECRDTCEPGIHPEEPPQWQTPWSCNVLGPDAPTPSPPPAQCSNRGEDCRSTKCCNDPGDTCYEKNQHWAGCRASCTAGIDPTDPPEHQTDWSCAPVDGASPGPAPPPPSSACSGENEDCRATRCCKDSQQTCYEKNEWWADCRFACETGVHPEDPPEHQTPWSCKELR